MKAKCKQIDLKKCKRFLKISVKISKNMKKVNGKRGKYSHGFHVGRTERESWS
jgi:hypothetical protein